MKMETCILRIYTDNSGTDIFTFSYGNTLEITSVPPLCEDASNGSIDIKIWGGRPPFYFELEDTLTKIRYTRLGKAEQYFTQLPAGFYNISVSDDNDRTLKSALLLEPVETLALNLPGIQLLETGKSIQLDASALHTGTATNYLWTSDNGFNSADALVELTEEGIYELIVQNENACTVKGNFTVKNSSNTISANTSGNSGNSTGKLTAGKAEYKAYPNPSPGFYNIEAILPETSEINIRIFNIEGKLLSEWKDRGKKHYRFNSDINMPGSYIVEFDTPFGKEKIKLIISK